MVKVIVLTFTVLLMSGCINKHGISAKYYSDCKEYYDMQGYYHKICGKDDIITYKEMQKKIVKKYNTLTNKKEPPKKNVW
jgi:hypothetical protein